jgi:hypothetical protein
MHRVCVTRCRNQHAGGAQDGAANRRLPLYGEPRLRKQKRASSRRARDDVFRWRLEQFLELGFSTEEAATLAESEAELAQARTVLGGGCTLAVAFRILL